MKIKNHRLYDDNDTPVNYVESPNRGGPFNPRFLVMHYTAGGSAAGAVSWLTSPTSKASAHLVIGRDGEVTQLIPFNRVAWHADPSSWQGLSGLNQHSIGIELDNAGKLQKDEQGNWHAWFNRVYPPEEVIVAKHKHQDQPAGWHTFTEKQLERAFEIALLLAKKYNLQSILGHEDVSPERKQDPGPAFPMATLQGRLLGRSENVDAPYGAVYTIPKKFVRVQNGQFVVDDRPFKFIGFNIRGLVHYGADYDQGQTFLKHTNNKQRREQLDRAFKQGARVIRVFLPHRNASAQQTGDRLEELLKIISKPPFNNQVYLLPALTDFLGEGHVPFKVGQDEKDGYYQRSGEHITATRDFFNGGYRKNYLPFVRDIVKRFKGEANIFAWEIMNEGKVNDEPDIFIDFNHQVARTIKSIDPNHMVTTGMVSCAHAYMGRGDQADKRQKLYQGEQPGERRLIDFVTVHYPHECHPNKQNPFLGCNASDIELAKSLGLPVIIEEQMIKADHPNEDRSDHFRKDMDTWFARGVNGYLIWGFDALGVGDGEIGGVGNPNNDWEPVSRIFTNYHDHDLLRWA